MPATKDTTARPSELEGAVLGLLWRTGPMTAHAVRQVFLESPTEHFSGSAGAIYPLIRRLHTAGSIAPSAKAEGAKGGKAYAITPQGRAALKAWIRHDDPASLASVTFDPLRTRVLSLGLLGPREREAFLRRAEQELSATAEQQTRQIAELAGQNDRWLHAAMNGALVTTRARLRWVRALRRELAET